MSIAINGIELTDAQMCAITPIINRHANMPRIDVAKMEAECLLAMKEAGYPLTEKEHDGECS